MKRVREMLTRIIAPVILFAVLILAWAAALSLFGWPSYIVPTPLQVWQALIAHGWAFLPDAWTTTQEVMLGFGAGLLCGLILAAAIASFPLLRNALYPALIFSQVVPIFVVSVVVTLMLLQFALLPQVVVTALYSFLPVVVTAADGLERVDPDLI